METVQGEGSQDGMLRLNLGNEGRGEGSLHVLFKQ